MGTKDDNGSGVCWIAAIGGAITGWVSWKVDNPYTWILVGRAIQGIGAAGAMPVVIPCVGDLYKDEKQVSTGLGNHRNIQHIWESAEPHFRICSFLLPLYGSYHFGQFQFYA